VSAASGQKTQESSRPADVAATLLLTEVRNRIGPVYGSETISLLLYALARRERPRNVLELGTGLGVSAFMIAQALKENGAGRIWTIDDGSHWHDRAKLAQAIAPLRGVAGLGSLDLGALDYAGFVRAMTQALGVATELRFLHERLDLGVDVDFTPARWPFLGEPIDMVFLDINHTPEPILDTLYYVLPHAAPCLSLFVDSASTSAVGYLFLETLVERLNRGKVPWRWMQRADAATRRLLVDLVATRRFTLVHLVERLNRAQNSTAWVRIEPADHMPHPPAAMKWV
jgi:predicted O-methyltransferase YrrM